MADGSLSQFKATLSRKIERNQKKKARADRNSASYKSSHSKSEYHFKKLSEPKLEEVKNNIREKIKLERRKEVIVISIILSVLISIVYILIK